MDYHGKKQQQNKGLSSFDRVLIVLSIAVCLLAGLIGYWWISELAITPKEPQEKAAPEISEEENPFF